jgi:hypothetical protein
MFLLAQRMIVNESFPNVRPRFLAQLIELAFGLALFELQAVDVGRRAPPWPSRRSRGRARGLVLARARISTAHRPRLIVPRAPIVIAPAQ